MSTRVGWATLQIIPSAKNFGRHLRDETKGPLADLGEEIGRSIGDEVANGVGDGLEEGDRRGPQRGWAGLKKAVHASITGALTRALAKPKAVIAFAGQLASSIRGGIARGATGIKKVFAAIRSEGVVAFGKDVLSKLGENIKEGFKKGLDAASDFIRDFVANARDTMRELGKTALASLRGLIETAAGTAATGGLNLLVSALLAIVAAIPAVVGGFVALAPVVLLAGGAFGTLFTVIAGGIGTMVVFKLGMTGVGDALAEVSENGKASWEVLKKLHPEARKFVKAWEGIQKPLDALKRFVQGKLFAGLGKELTTLSKRWLKPLKPTLGVLATSINRVGKELFKALGKPDFVLNMARAMRGFGGFIDRIGKSLGPLIDAFGRLAAGSVPFLDALGSGVGDVIDNFAAWIKEAEKSGALKTFMTDAAQALKDIWAIGGLVIGILGELIDTLFPSSKKTADSYLGGTKAILEDIKAWLADENNKKKLQEMLDKIVEFVKKAATEWIPKAIEWMTNIDGFITKIGEWVDKIKGLADVIDGALNPLDAIFGDTTKQIGKHLDDSAKSMDGKGQAIGAGVAAGIRKSSPSIIAAVKNSITDKIPDYVKRVLGIHSPSRVFMAFGRNIAEGMALGIYQGTGKVTKAVGALTAIPGSGAVPVSVTGALAARSAVPSTGGTTEYHLHDSKATLAQLEALQRRQEIESRHRRAR